MKALHMVAFFLLLAGGLNWLFVGLMDLNIVEWLLGRFGDIVPRTIYVLVGLAAVYEILTHKKNCRGCSTTATPTV